MATQRHDPVTLGLGNAAAGGEDWTKLLCLGAALAGLGMKDRAVE